MRALVEAPPGIVGHIVARAHIHGPLGFKKPTSYEVDIPKEIISLGCRSHECQRSCSTFDATRRGSSTSECQICSFKRYIQ